MEEPRLKQIHDFATEAPLRERAKGLTAQSDDKRSNVNRSFDDQFVELFDAHFHRLFRYLDRLSGDPDVAADVAQDAFVRLYKRGSVPDTAGAWLVSVAMNLFRNVQSTKRRRFRLLTPGRAERVHSDAAPSPDQRVERDEIQQRVRLSIDQLPEREQRMLLLRAEGFSYREIAIALDISEASVGTLLARAQRQFRQRYQDDCHAP